MPTLRPRNRKQAAEAGPIPGDAESHELRAAVLALSRGHLSRAAELYERAAEIQEDRGVKPFALERSAIALWMALGRPERARARIVRRLRRPHVLPVRERAWLETRLGEIFWNEGADREALAAFRAAASRLRPRDHEGLEAQLAAVRCELRAGSLDEARARLRAVRRLASGAGQRIVEAEAALLAAQLAERTEAPASILESYDAAITFAATEGLRAVQREGLVRAARLALSWRLDARAYAWAESSHRMALLLRDPVATAEGAILVAGALISLAERTEREEGRGTAPGLARDAQRLLRDAAGTLRRQANPVRQGEALLLAARLARGSSPRRGRRHALEAKAWFRRASLAELAVVAEWLALECSKGGGGIANWESLARRAEALGLGEVAQAAWLAVARLVPQGGGKGAAEIALRARALRSAHLWSRRPTPGGITGGILAPSLGATLSGRAALELATDALAAETEPKRHTLEWVLTARETERHAASSPAGRLRALPDESAETRYFSERVARFERATTGGLAAPRPAQETALWRRQLAYFRHLGAERFRAAPSQLPGLEPGTALVVLSPLAGGVHIWCLRGETPPLHCETMPLERWTSWARRLERETAEARGWPDAMVPESLAERARKTLREFGSEIWTQLIPGLHGTARLLVLPDPSLPLLPYSALLLAADPASWPRPRSVSLLTSPPAARVPRWQLVGRRVLALSSSHPDRVLGAREARSAARVLDGRAISGDRLVRSDLRSRGGAGGQPSPRSLLRQARVLYLSTPLRFDAENPFLSRLALGQSETSLPNVLPQADRLRLLVLTDAEPIASDDVRVGRVVGAIGPRGARSYGNREIPRRGPEPSPQRFLAALLREATDRVLLALEPETRVHPSPVPGAFCAGLARGDTPAESLFLAQRHAWNEELHPVLWSGYSLWERA